MNSGTDPAAEPGLERLATNIAMNEKLRTWVLLGARAGDNDQVIALAEALGLAFELKPLRYRSLHLLGPRLLGPSLASIPLDIRRSLLDEPPPDLTISTGHRSVPIVRALRRLSRGRTRSFHVGFPRVSPSHFDLVIATPQYPIQDSPRLLRIPYALTRAARAHPPGARVFDFGQWPEPRLLLSVGGPTLFWDLDTRELLEVLDTMLEDARRAGGSVMVSASPRTPAPIKARLRSILAEASVATLFAQPGQQPDYRSLLSAASSIRVTADSVSMISDAIWTGKPVALVPIAASALGRTMFALRDRLGLKTQAYPQDLRFFWRALADIGINERLAVPRADTDKVLAAIRQRASAALSRPSVLTR